jgi:hypothetical protein
MSDRAAIGRDILDQVDDELSHLVAIELAIGAQQSRCVRNRQQLERRGGRAVVTALEGFEVVGAEECGDRHPEHLGNRGQLTRAELVHAFFVSLDLLEGDTNPFGKRGLRQAALQSLDTNSLPDLDIDGIGLLSGNHSCPQE